MEIGSRGLQEVNLTIPQSTSLTFTVVHKDEDGSVVDHSSSTCSMAIQKKDKSETYDLSECCVCTGEGISVSIPKSETEKLPLDKLVWDLIVETAGGGVTRLCYGKVTVVDTYALDEE